MSIKWIVAKNTLAQIFTKFITASSTLIVTLLIARSFGVEGFGEFTKVVTYVSFFYLIADFGFNAVFVLEADDDLSNLKNQFLNFLLLRSAWTFFLIVLLITILSFLPGGNTSGFTPLSRLGILTFSVTVFFQGIIVSCNSLFQKTLHYHYATISTIIGSFASLICVLGVVSSPLRISEQGIIWMLSCLSLGSAISALSALFYTTKALGSLFSLTLDSSFLRLLFSKGILLGATLFAAVSISHTGRFVLTISRSTAEVGIYGLAYKFFEFPLSLPTFFMNSMFPLFISSRKASSMELQRRIQQSFSLLLISSVFIGIFLYIGAPLLSLIKEDFVDSIPVFRTLALFLPIFFLSSLTMWLLVLFEYRGLLLSIYGIFMGITVLVSYIYIPLYGNTAAALLVGLVEAGILCTSAITLFVKRK